ncbi:MAG: BolA/IbaG family iron-sulfur metabolism protein [Venatoribacter sp.]
MSIAETIKAKLQELAPLHLELQNESHMHAAQALDSHYKLVLVSEAFSGVRTVARHQKVYALLAEELRGPVHALALHLYDPQEWQQTSVPKSPNCMGHGH